MYEATDAYAIYATDMVGAGCDVIPETLPGGIPNPVHCTCKLILTILEAVFHAVVTAMGIVKQVIDNEWELATLSPHHQQYGYDYINAAYLDMTQFHDWKIKSLSKINGNINEQHTSMRQHLQDRHLAMEVNIGQDIFDLQNALGKSIVDARNANGKAVVDASNDVSDQHNKILKWMHDDFPIEICQVYQATGGVCQTFIGPLEEDEAEIIPMELHWQEHQPTLIDGLKQIEAIDKKIKSMSGIEGKVEDIENKINGINASLDQMEDMLSLLITLTENK